MKIVLDMVPDAIVAFRHTPNGSGHAVDVFLNFSRREIELDLSTYSGRELFFEPPRRV
jgi:hypothetical protein